MGGWPGGVWRVPVSHDDEGVGVVGVDGVEGERSGWDGGWGDDAWSGVGAVASNWCGREEAGGAVESDGGQAGVFRVLGVGGGWAG